MRDAGGELLNIGCGISGCLLAVLMVVVGSTVGLILGVALAYWVFFH